MDFRIEWPEPMDESDWADQEAKGWLDVTVSWDGGSRVVEVYDPVRLAQSVTGEIARIGRFSSGGLLVVPSVTPENIQSAVAAIAGEGFFERG
jgi:hypothetical protein